MCSNKGIKYIDHCKDSLGIGERSVLMLDHDHSHDNLDELNISFGLWELALISVEFSLKSVA